MAVMSVRSDGDPGAMVLRQGPWHAPVCLRHLTRALADAWRGRRIPVLGIRSGGEPGICSPAARGVYSFEDTPSRYLIT
jgi:hypothetical protein